MNDLHCLFLARAIYTLLSRALSWACGWGDEVGLNVWTKSLLGMGFWFEGRGCEGQAIFVIGPHR